MSAQKVWFVKTTKEMIHSKNWQEKTPLHIEFVAHDHMPKEVAIEILCSPKARLTNRQRKNCRSALETRYQSTRVPKDAEVKRAAKLKTASLEQLGRWLRRDIVRRNGVQVRYQKLQVLREKLVEPAEDVAPIIKQQYAFNVGVYARGFQVLDLRAAMLDGHRDAVEVELERRQNCLTKLQSL